MPGVRERQGSGRLPGGAGAAARGAAALSRADRIAAAASERELDALLVSAPCNLRYATGFTGTNGAALIGSDRRAFITDFRYVEQAAAQVAGFDLVRGERDLLEDVARALEGAGELRLGFDDANTSVRTHARLEELLPGTVELVAAGGVVEELREIKDAGEVERIAAAAALAEAALEHVVAQGLAGRTEREVALALEREMVQRGADEPSFPSIVAAGEHSSRPHAEPRDVEIPAGTLVTIDFGARLDGYCSDCTRTFATGPVGEEETEVYALVQKAQEAALAAVEPGAEGSAVDAVARDRIEAAGHGEHFGHGLGHGVGLEVHEAPRLSKQSDSTLRAGQVVTVEPGVYVPGRFGVRIEDLVVVTDEGRRVLSSYPKDLVEAG